MKLKKIAAAVLTAVMLVSACLMPAGALGYGEEWQGSSTVHTKKYKDVPTSHWAYENIMLVTERGWFSGYPDGTFGVNRSITRAEATKVFVQFLGMKVEEVSSTSFHDVDVNKWYAPYVEAGKDLMPVHTAPDGTTPFQPEMPVTREDTMYALVVALGYDSEVRLVDESVLNMFKDQSSISRNVRPYLAYAVSNGLVTGKDDGTIDARGALTRAEFATLLRRGSEFGFNDRREAKLQSVTITAPEDARKDMKVGESFTIKAEALYTDGSPKDYEINDAYNADKNGVVEISQSRVTAKQPGNCVIKFKDENLKDQSIVVIVTKETGAVSLDFNNYADTTYESFITLSGTAKDSKGDTVTLKCNNRSVMVESNGRFEHIVQLNPGQNRLEFVASNSAGTTFSKSIVITRKEVGRVSITFDDYSNSTYSDRITLSGKVNNTVSGDVTVTCNGQTLPLDRENTFSKEYSLRVGENTFNFEAKNEGGDKVSKEITIVRQDPGTLTLNVNESDVGSTTTAGEATITGSVYNSKGGRITLTCNGTDVSVNQDGTFSVHGDLAVGRNTFEFEAKNEGGVTATETITIERQDLGTVSLAIPDLNRTTSYSYITISGVALDSKGGQVTLMCNGSYVSVNSDGTFEVYLSLWNGTNQFEFVATNEAGASAVKTVTVERTSGW